MKLSKSKGVVIAALIAITSITLYVSNLTHKEVSFSEKHVWTEMPNSEGGRIVTYQKDYRIDYHSEVTDTFSMIKKSGKVE